MLAFIFIPVVQKELDEFSKVVWNHSRGRKQENKELPTGIPEYIFDNPEEFGVEDCGVTITEANLLAVGNEYHIDLDECFIDPVLYERFSTIIDVNELQPKDTCDAFLYLKEKYEHH